MHFKLLPVNDGQRNEIPSAVALLLIVEDDTVVRVAAEFNLNGDLVVCFEPVHPHVTLAIKGRHLVIPLVYFFVAEQTRVVWAADANERCPGQINTRGGFVARRGEAGLKYLRRRIGHVISCKIKKKQ